MADFGRHLSPERPRKRGEKGNDIRQLALLSVIPALMVVAPFVGFFIGNWADGKFGTEPFLAILGLILGFAAAGKEIYKVIKRVSQSKEENKN